MLFFDTTKIIAIAAAVIVFVSSVVGGIWYVSGLKASLAISQENSRKLESAVEDQKEAIANLQREQEQIKNINAELKAEAKSREKDLSNLRNRFDKDVAGRHRDFGKAAVEKPVSIERAVNRGTINAARCMEIASGSPLTEAEKNATKPEEINKECPSLANPNYKRN